MSDPDKPALESMPQWPERRAVLDWLLGLSGASALKPALGKDENPRACASGSTSAARSSRGSPSTTTGRSSRGGGWRRDPRARPFPPERC